MVRRKRKGKARKWLVRIVTAILAVPALYLLAALVGAIVPLNWGWTEPAEGTTVYLADNGIHLDILMPVDADGLDWSAVVPRRDFGAADPAARWIAIGGGAEHVYLNTPTWFDLTPRTLWRALTGDRRVLHVEYVDSPGYAVRAIRLRPEEYHRLWAAIRADFARDPQGRIEHIDHPGFGRGDTFYRGAGKANAIHTCNAWVADKLRLAGVKTSLWSPFPTGLTWRYRRAA